MTKFTDNSSRFAKSIPTGQVVLEVKKEGFLPFNESIVISPNEGERYLVVTLKPEGNSGK